MYKISEKIKIFITNAIKKLEYGMDSGRTNPSRGKNPKRHLPIKITLATSIRYRNDATQLGTQERKVGTNLQNHRKIIVIFCAWLLQRYLLK